MLHRLLRIDVAECTFERRGFMSSTSDVEHTLEAVGKAFLHGYHLALVCADPRLLAQALDEGDTELQGFRYEGASMALKLGDLLIPLRTRWHIFALGPGIRHIYMIYVGAGWAYARVPWFSAAGAVRGTDSILEWLIVDGYGFHEGYFGGITRVLQGCKKFSRAPYMARASDQGLGRSLWFICGADPRRIATVIHETAPERHGDLWSGIGLAAAYAGPATSEQLEALTKYAGNFFGHLAQGAAFAAQARQRAGNAAAHTDRACAWLCGVSSEEAARVTEAELPGSSQTTSEAYEAWRSGIRRHFASVREIA
jgi:enediyne biosynthesis protein E3